MKIITVILLAALLIGCGTTHDGASYIRKELDVAKCWNGSPPPSIELTTAKPDCIKYTVNDEAEAHLKNGVALITLDWILEVHRNTYKECMAKKGFVCDWPLVIK
jgi:hypothetical protein